MPRVRLCGLVVASSRAKCTSIPGLLVVGGSLLDSMWAGRVEWENMQRTTKNPMLWNRIGCFLRDDCGHVSVFYSVFARAITCEVPRCERRQAGEFQANGLIFVLFSDCAVTQVAELILLSRMAVSWKSVV